MSRILLEKGCRGSKKNGENSTEMKKIKKTDQNQKRKTEGREEKKKGC
jgi:hypothetical protein